MKIIMALFTSAMVLLGCASKHEQGDEAAAKVLAAERKSLELEAELREVRAEYEQFRTAAGETKPKPPPESRVAGPDLMPEARSQVGFFPGPAGYAPIPPSQAGVDACAVGATGPGIAYVDGFPSDMHASREGRQRDCGGRCAAVYNNTPDYMALFVDSGMVTICSGRTSMPHLMPVMQQKGGQSVGEYVYVVHPNERVKMRFDSGQFRITAKFYSLSGAGGALSFERERKAGFRLPYVQGGHRDPWGLVHTFR
jgi:hypothetical protein